MPVIHNRGALVQYQRTGRGPAVLLIQGVGVIGEGWRPQIEGLADRFTLISFDNRGIGASRILGGRLTVEDMAADGLAIMDAEGINQCHVVGHSMGGVIAQELALSAPERVSSLGLLCTFVRGQDGARMSPGMLLTALRMRVGSRAMRRNAFMELVMPARYLQQADRVALAERLGRLFGRDLADQPPIVMKQLRAMSRYDASSRLAQLAHIPTLVVSAREDRIAPPSQGRAIAAAIPGSRYVDLAEAGHGVPIQRAEEINNLLAAHFAGTAVGISRSGVPHAR
jgi:aminoacrylate hydrolase